jgi:hypothetical protein
MSLNNISTTTRDIQKSKENLFHLFLNCEETEISNNISDEQSIREKQLLVSEPICSMDLLEKLSERLGNLDSKKLKEITKEQQLNQFALKAAACTTQSAVYLSPFNQGDINRNIKIKHYIKNLRKIGDNSAYGNAFIADLKDGNEFFVIKTGKTKKSSEDLLHELIVGLYGTNNLRALIPNFSYIYGGFRCSPPYIDKQGNVTSWCTSENEEDKVNYIIYESIDNSKSYYDFIENCTGMEFLNTYLQVIYALRTANKYIDFTHYDLHTSNVLIKYTKNNNFNAVKYETENGEEYITTKHVPIIIDYGFSHIQHEGEHYGVNGFRQGFVKQDKSWIFHDLYKFLMFSMEAAYTFNNTDVINIGETIFKFFNDSEDLKSALYYQRVYYFSFPETENYNIDSFSRFIRSRFDANFINKENIYKLELFGSSSELLSEESVYNNIGINPYSTIEIPTNVVEFFILDKKLSNSLTYEDRFNLYKNSSQVILIDLINIINTQISNISYVIFNSTYEDYESYNLDIYNYITFNIINEDYDNSMKIIESYKYIQELLIISEYIISEYNKFKLYIEGPIYGELNNIHKYIDTDLKVLYISYLDKILIMIHAIESKLLLDPIDKNSTYYNYFHNKDRIKVNMYIKDSRDDIDSKMEL